MDFAAANRILVVTKFRYLGDTIVATPFLRELRKAKPDAHISLLTGPSLTSVLQGCPYVDDIQTFDADRQRSSDIVRRLREAKYNTAFVLNRSFSSAVLAWRARIPVRIGFNTEFRRILLSHPIAYDTEKREIDCYLDLLRSVGITCEYSLPELWVTHDEQSAMRERIGHPSHPIVLMQPGSKDAYKKEWGTEKFSAVAKALGIQPILIGAPDEGAACAAVAKVTGAIDMSGKTSLREVLALISIADLLIANDTALVHAAVGLNTPTLTIHGPQTAKKWRYDTAIHKAVVASSQPGRLDRRANRRALDQLQPQPVIEIARQMLSAVESASRT